MIVVRTPFRISFIGGGSDLKEFYAAEPGAVLSVTINKYMYLMLHPYFYNKIRIKYSRTEDVETITQIKHPIVRECLRLMKVSRGIEIASIADVPAGTGLGSSSAFTVGLLQALHTFNGRFASIEKLAQEASKIEIDKLKEPIGKQDQYAVSYGGLNFIRFNKDDSVNVQPLLIGEKLKETLENRLLLFYMGATRKAASILKWQQTNIKGDKLCFERTKKIVELAGDMNMMLSRGRLDHFGEILHEGWMVKRLLSNGITNSIIDEYYDKARKAGAIGGKILGAGGGGFLLVYCLPKSRNKIQNALRLQQLNFKFDTEGTKVIFTDSQW
jgi:D-glycero-alpha-D-manno-heptose-7-phosphate kinase